MDAFNIGAGVSWLVGRQNDPAFWWLLFVLFIAVVFLGTRLFLQHSEEARRQREDDERRQEEQ